MHPGANDGYKNYTIAYPLRKQGVVIMTNSDSGDALWREILNSVSVEYGWVQAHTALYAEIAITGVLVVGIVLLPRSRS